MSQRNDATGSATWPWIAFVAITSLALSRAFACAMPFAALATLAALTLRDRDAIGLVLMVWLGNQLIGFGLMHYPWTGSTLGWGLAIGVAALAAWAAARVVARLVPAPSPVVTATGVVGAYAAYELVLFAATAVLRSGPDAFAAAVVLRIFAINLVAFALLVAAQRLAGAAGLPASSRPSLPVS